jgi:putative oxidoreductase
MAIVGYRALKQVEGSGSVERGARRPGGYRDARCRKTCRLSTLRANPHIQEVPRIDYPLPICRRTQPISPSDTRYVPYILAALRIVAGLLFLGHGIVKLSVGCGARPTGPLEFVRHCRRHRGCDWRVDHAGPFTRAAAFLASGEMAVAYWMVHAPQSLYPAVSGGDAAILFCFVFLYVAAAGPGAFSLDGLLRKPGSETKRYSQA